MLSAYTTRHIMQRRVYDGIIEYCLAKSLASDACIRVEWSVRTHEVHCIAILL